MFSFYSVLCILLQYCNERYGAMFTKTQAIIERFKERHYVKIKGRIFTNMSIAFAIIFTTLLFGILDIFLNNIYEFRFSLSDFIVPLLLISMVAVIFATLIMSIFRGQWFYLVSALGLGFLIAEYIQAQFVNAIMQELNGQDVSANFGFQTIGNLFLWLAIFAVCIFLAFVFKTKWNKICVFASLLLVIMQGSALAVSFINNLDALNTDTTGEYILTTDNITELSSKENTVVFIVDTVDADYTNEILEIEPSFYEPLDGFTYFNNNLSVYSKTYPTVTYMLTGEFTKCDLNFKDYFDKAPKNDKKEFMVWVEANVPSRIKAYVREKYYDKEYNLIKSKSGRYMKLCEMETKDNE